MAAIRAFATPSPVERKALRQRILAKCMKRIPDFAAFNGLRRFMKVKTIASA